MAEPNQRIGLKFRKPTRAAIKWSSNFRKAKFAVPGNQIQTLLGPNPMANFAFPGNLYFQRRSGRTVCASFCICQHIKPLTRSIELS